MRKCTRCGFWQVMIGRTALGVWWLCLWCGLTTKSDCAGKILRTISVRRT